MEPITAAVLATKAVDLFLGLIKNSEELKKFKKDFGDAFMKDVRAIFLTDEGNENKYFKDIQSDPDNPVNRPIVEAIVNKEISEDTEKYDIIHNYIKKASEYDTQFGIKDNIIKNSKNVMQNVKIEGKIKNFHQGDKF